MIGSGKNKDFGLNIITEVIDTKNDKGDYEGGISTRTHGDIYTDDALILQSILKYSENVGISKPFTDQSITEYLVQPKSECEVFKNRYSGNDEKTNFGSRIKENIDRINDALRKLEYLELVITEPFTHKTDIRLQQYKFTRLGKIIGLLLLYEKGKIKDSKELWSSLIDFYWSMNNSWSTFYIIFLRKCINIPKVFEMVISFHIKSLKNADSNKDLSIEQLTKVPVILNKEYWNVFNESLDELEKNHLSKYRILLYALSLLVEEQQENSCANFKGFEGARHIIRNLPLQVTLEGYCNLCELYSHVGINVMDYLNSYIYSDPNNRHNHLNAVCPACNGGPLYFEVIKVRTISGNPVLDKKSSRKKFDLLVFEGSVDIHNTIFNTSSRSKRYQAILKFLLDNSNEFFTTTDLMDSLLETESEIFKVNKKTKSKPSNNYYYQFESYLGALQTCGLVISEKVRNKKNKSSLVDAYQLSYIAGKTFALLSKWQSGDINKEKTYDKIYQCWVSSFDDPPISSLDLFCKSYLYECKKQGLFDVFVQSFNKFLNSNYYTYNNVDLFTYITLSKFDDGDGDKNDEENRLKNEKLWVAWLETYLKLDEQTEILLLTHIQIHLTRRIGRRIHDLGKYERERYRYKDVDNYLTIEATCLNCTGEYLYLPVPVINYVPFLFGVDSNEIKDAFSEQIMCRKCEKDNFDFIRV